MNVLPTLFWIFLKINLLSTSGAASTGLLYNEAVGTFLPRSNSCRRWGFPRSCPAVTPCSSPCSSAIPLPEFRAVLISILAAILPPTVLMLGVVLMLHRFQREAWVSRFVEGLTPAVAVLILVVAWKISAGSGDINWQALLLGGISLVALIRDLPAPLVLLACGTAGIFLFR
jgi:chromate transport protein ChrA